MGRLVAAARAELRQRESVVLLMVLLLGALIRLALSWQFRPGLAGYPDSFLYVADAVLPVYPFYDPLRVSGYAVFIRQVLDLTGDLQVVTVLQHVLGMLTAVALYATLRAAGVRSRWAAVLPAATVSLSGVVILFEHAYTTETLWTALLAFATLALVLAARAGRSVGGGLAWAATAGLLIGASVEVRLPSLLVIPAMAVWLLVCAPGGWLRRGSAVALLVVLAAVPILAWSNWQKRETGRAGLSRNGALNLYGRVAPWADCTKFTPPKGTEFLCETTAEIDRPGHDAYLFEASPATTKYDVLKGFKALPADGAAKIQAWSKAAILGQPVDYLRAVARESRRLIRPTARGGIPGQTRDGYGLGPSSYPPLLERGANEAYIRSIVAKRYGAAAGRPFRRGSIGLFNGYEETTRMRPILMALLVALALMAPFVTRGPERRAAWLLTPMTVILLEGPVATSLYDFRYVVPVFGFLVAAAAVGAWGVTVSARGWWAARAGGGAA